MKEMTRRKISPPCMSKLEGRPNAARMTLKSLLHALKSGAFRDSSASSELELHLKYQKLPRRVSTAINSPP